MSYTVQAETHELPLLLATIYRTDAEMLTRVIASEIHTDFFPSDYPDPGADGFWSRLKVQEYIIPGGTLATVDGSHRPGVLVVAEIAHLKSAAFRPAPLLMGILRRVQQLTVGTVPNVTRCRVIDPVALVRRPTEPQRAEDPDRWWSSVRFALTVKPL